MDYDFIIVGSGSVGAAAGYYATQAGLNVLMIDSAHPPHDKGSHHGASRLIRHAYGEGEKYVPLVLRAQALWHELEQASGDSIFQRTGVLNLGPSSSSFMTNVLNSAQQWQLALEQLERDDIEKRWPQISVPEGFTGLFEPDSGVLRCEVAVSAWIRLAMQAGCAQLFNCPVNQVYATENGIAIETPEGIWTAKKVLISAGTWVTKLFPELPITPVRKVFAWHQADGRYSANNHFPAFTAELENGDQYYGFPSDNNELKIGKHNGGQLIHNPEQRTPFGGVVHDGSEVFHFLRQVLPGIGVCLHGAACTYDNSPDEDFIIDTLPNLPQAMVITGLSGHGFKFAPVLGEIASQFASDIPCPFDLSPFSLKRF